MSKLKRKIKSLAQKNGYIISNDFVILSKNESIISGLALDSTPSTTYIWLFILPSYDKIPFLHMSLGERILKCEVAEACFQAGIVEFGRRISSIKSPLDLIDYLDRCSLDSEYAKWVKFISMIRLGRFEDAFFFLNNSVGAFISPTITENYMEIQLAYNEGGRHEVQSLLNKWSEITGQLISEY